MKYLLILGMLCVAGCGYEEVGTEAVGQVKSVINNTPVFCNNYASVDVSLGVIKNGVGSMSTHDMKLTVENPADVHALKKAAATGKLVKVTYNNKRWTWCVLHHIVTNVEIVD